MSDIIESKPLLIEQSEQSSPSLVNDHNGSATILQSVYNIVCVIAGVGVLNLPFALSQTGWIGICVFIVAAFVNYYTGCLLQKSLHLPSGENFYSYREIGLAAFGPKGSLIVEIFHKSTLLSVCSVFIILAGNLIFADIQVPGLTIELATLFCGLVFLVPVLFIKTMKDSSVLGFIGMISTITVVLIVLAVIGVEATNQPPATTQLFSAWGSFASASASIVFSFSGNTVYPEIERSMKNPKQFNQALLISVITVLVIYLPIACVGYAVYGVNVVSPILLTLPQLTVTRIANGLMIAHVLMAYPVAFSAVAIEFERNFNINSWAPRSLLRIVLWGLTVAVAVLVPNFGLFMSLSSALTNTTLVFILPVLFYFRLYKKYNSISKVEYAAGLFVMLLGAMVGFFGGWDALNSLL